MLADVSPPYQNGTRSVNDLLVDKVATTKSSRYHLTHRPRNLGGVFLVVATTSTISRPSSGVYVAQVTVWHQEYRYLTKTRKIVTIIDEADWVKRLVEKPTNSQR